MNRPFRKRLLIVDDEADIRYLFRTALHPHYEVLEAESGAEAVQLALRTSPDVVLLDVMLPQLSGFDVLTALRHTPATSQSKIVMLTASASPTAVAKGMALGADLFLTKPITALSLKQLIHTVADDLDGRMGTLAEGTLRPTVLPDQRA